MLGLPVEALEQVATYFQALSETTRLRILAMLRDGERNVGDLAQACECTSANVSRHLAILMKHGLVTRSSRGNSVYYRIADESVYALCDMVCGNIARQFEQSALNHRPFVEAGAARQDALPGGEKPG